MGFCLFNNIAVTAAAIASRGERVLIIDWDAHHGNGTQEMFWHDPAVFYLSIHQYPFYPGTGALGDVGEGRGRGATLNVPLPAGSTGQVYRAAMEEVMAAAAERHCPDWLLVSAGFDAHRDDPLTDLGLSAGDFADMTAFCATIVPPGRRIFFLEGGYDLQALELSVEACIRALGGDFAYPEPPSRPGPADEMGREAVFSAARLHFG
jgi:acetoin utilization deacetylase AcuC-like enzyme